MRKSIAVLLIVMITLLSACTGGEYETRSIKGLKLVGQEETTSSGTFVLGVGTYKSESSVQTKYYLYVLKNEGYVLTEIDANRLEIVETDEIEPCINGRFYYNRLQMDWDCTVYVPIGTIFEEYSAILP